MPHFTGVTLCVVASMSVWAQQVSLSPSRSAEVSSGVESPSKPTLTTSPPDATVPDPGSVAAPDNAKRSVAKRALDELLPRCLDGIVHTCWSQPPGSQPASASMATLRYGQNMEIANFYLKQKNYAGAELRLREALEALPHSPEAIFKLALSLDKLHKTVEAREAYLTYLRLQPSGVFSKEATRALQRLPAAK